MGRDGGDEQILYRVSQTGHALLCRSSCCIFLYKDPSLVSISPNTPSFTGNWSGLKPPEALREQGTGAQGCPVIRGGLIMG